MEKTKFTYAVSDNTIQLNVNREPFYVRYERPFLKDIGKENSARIAENLIYLLTMPISIISSRSEYPARPFFEGLIHQGVLKDIPRITEETRENTAEVVSAFERRKVVFKDNRPGTLSLDGDRDPESVLSGISFGKDSLLSFGVAEELGFDMNLVFANDTEELDINEYRHKMGLVKKFNSQVGKKIHILHDNTDKIFVGKNRLVEEFTRTNAMLAYTLEFLPIAAKLNSRHIILGNEQNFNDGFINKEGVTAYPSYDQSSEYMEASNIPLNDFGGGFQVVSLVEPLYNIAEYKVLLSRYPKFLEYLMSCSGNERDKWCYDCPMCAKTYLYSLAVGIDKKKFGFKANFFDKKFRDFYPLFNPDQKRPYEKPKAVRDEQLFAFYLAHKNKAKGYLIDKFKKDFLEEAKESEDDLYNRFFKVYNAVSIPTKIKSRVNSLYREELKL